MVTVILPDGFIFARRKGRRSFCNESTLLGVRGRASARPRRPVQALCHYGMSGASLCPVSENSGQRRFPLWRVLPLSARLATVERITGTPCIPIALMLGRQIGVTGVGRRLDRVGHDRSPIREPMRDAICTFRNAPAFSPPRGRHVRHTTKPSLSGVHRRLWEDLAPSAGAIVSPWRRGRTYAGAHSARCGPLPRPILQLIRCHLQMPLAAIRLCQAWDN